MKRMKSYLIVALVWFVSACSAVPNLEVDFSPAAADSPVPHTRYAPVLAGTADYHPVSVKDWVESNDQVAPKEGGK